MSYLGDKDFLIEVSKGNVEGHSLVQKSGRSVDVASGVFSTISLLGTATTVIDLTAKLRIKAGGSADDDSSGDGARSVLISGIVSDLTEKQETLVTSGASASLESVNSFWRCDRATVITCGTYGGSNVGDIIVETAAGTLDVVMISALQGVSQHAAYSIPLGKTGFLLSVFVTVDGKKAADVRLCSRTQFNDVIPPVGPTKVLRYWDGVLGSLVYVPRSPGNRLPELSDIWVDAQGDGMKTEVSVDFEILLVDN